MSHPRHSTGTGSVLKYLSTHLCCPRIQEYLSVCLLSYPCPRIAALLTPVYHHPHHDKNHAFGFSPCLFNNFRALTKPDMSLTVQQLNGDTTFLLTFRPSIAPDGSSKRFPGDFTILADPWLKGSSSILHPKFQISYHTTDSLVPSLADLIELPDIILISEDNTDQCHNETLCSLPKDAYVRIELKGSNVDTLTELQKHVRHS